MEPEVELKSSRGNTSVEVRFPAWQLVVIMIMAAAVVFSVWQTTQDLGNDIERLRLTIASILERIERTDKRVDTVVERQQDVRERLKAVEREIEK